MLNLLRKIFGVHSPSLMYIKEQEQACRLFVDAVAEGMKQSPPWKNKK